MFENNRRHSFHRENPTGLFTALLVFFTFIAGCNSEAQPSRPGPQTAKTELIFESRPAKWRNGDSVFISASFRNQELGAHYQGFGYIAPEEIDSMRIRKVEGTHVMDLIWIPDSLSTDQPHRIRFEESFEDKKKGLLLEQKESVIIVSDPNGQFKFQMDQNSYKIDTTIWD